MNKVNIFLFYGVRTHMNEVRSSMSLVGEKSIYNFIHEKELQYQQIGPIEGTENIIIGKNLHMEYEFDSIIIDLEDKKIKLKNQEEIDILSNEQKIEVKNNLIQTGLFDDPEYILFVNYC